MKRLLLFFAGLCLLCVPIGLASQNLVITEIMYNDPSGGNNGDSLEFIELYNNTSMPMNLNGYQFTAGITYTFPATVLMAEGYLIIAKNAAAVESFFNLTNVHQWDAGQALSNNGEGIVIKNIAAQTMDSVRYYTAAPWPTNASGQGGSLMRCNPSANGNLGASWSGGAVTNAYAYGTINNLTVFATPMAPCNVMPPYNPVYGTIPYTQSFDSLWINGDDLRDVPSNNWRNNPATGNASWRRNDDGGAALWTNATSGAYTPGGALGTSNSARFHTAGTTAGNQGIFDLYLNFTTPGLKKLSFWYLNLSGTDSLSIRLSDNAGLTYVALAQFITTAGWEYKQVLLGNITAPQCVVRFMSTSNYTASDIGIDEVSVFIAPDHDAGLESILAPAPLVFVPSQAITARIANYGNLDLTSADVYYAVDGVTGPPLPWSGTLVSGQVSSPINLGTINLSPLTATQVKIWTSNPNGNPDGDPGNDTLAVTTYYQTKAALPFYEGFDNDWVSKFGVNDAPSAYWNNKPPSGNASWRREDDGASANWTALTTGGYTPAGASGTSHSARFHTSGNVGGTVGILDLYLDFSTITGNKEMRFYHINSAGNDSVAVWISFDGGGTFHFLQKYTTAASWTLRTIDLGNSASADVVLRFRCTSNQGGNTDPGIDEIVIDQPQPDAQIQAILAPVSGCALTTAEPVRIRIRNNGSLPLTSIPATIYVNGNPSMETIPATLQPGDTLTYTFTTPANLQSPGQYQVAVALHYPGDYNPANDSTRVQVTNVAPIGAFPFLEDFESGTTDYFLLSNRANSHAVVKENVGNQNSYGLNMDGNVAGTWPSGSGSSTTAALAWDTYTDHHAFALSCQVDGSTLVNPELKLDLRQTYISNGGNKYSWFRVLVNDTTVLANNAGTTNFNPLTQSSDPFASQSFSLAAFAGTSFKLTLQSSCKFNDANANGGYGDNVYLDNIVIREKPAFEAAMTGWVSPIGACGMSQETVSVTLKNQGSSSLSAIPVAYSTDNGLSWVSEVIAATLDPDSSLTYAFTATADFTTTGVYHCLAAVSFPGDADNSNDTIKVVITSIPFIALSGIYQEDFENGEGGWSGVMISGKNEWEYGTPSQNNINTAHSGSNAWMTGLSQNYSVNTSSYLLSPCFDFTAMTNPYLSVWLRLRTENNYDGMIMEVSINDSTWFKPLADAGFYNNTSTQPPLAPPKWSGNNNGWTKYTTSLPDLAGKQKAQIRFRFESDYTQVDEGVAIDDIQLFEPYPDVALEAILSPLSACGLTATEAVTITVRNEGLVSISGIPVGYSLNLTPSIHDTIADTLLPGASMDYTFTSTIDLSVPGYYFLSVACDLPGDLNMNNDYKIMDIYSTSPAPFPLMIDFENITYANYLGATTGANCSFLVDPVVGNNASMGGFFVGGQAGSWPGNSGTTTTAAQAWGYADHVGELYTCTMTIPQTSPVGLYLDLRQTYSDGPRYSWFRVVVNDTVQLADVFGQMNFNPLTSNLDPYSTYLFDLSPYAPELTLSLQASCKFDGSGSSGYPDAVYLDNIVVDILDALPENQQGKASLYPNPATSSVQLVLPAQQGQQVLQVISSQGQVVIEKTLKGEQLLSLDISSLPAGIYAVKLHGPGQQQVLRFVKVQ